MKSKITNYLKEIALFFIVMPIFANLVSFYKSSDINQEPLKNITFTLMNGSIYNVQKGEPILIHFWAPWCTICKIEASNIDFISQKYNVITVAVQAKNEDAIHNFLAEHDVEFKVFNDKDGFLAREFKIAGYPTTLIYDREKKLLFSEVGYTTTLGLWVRMWWAGF